MEYLSLGINPEIDAWWRSGEEIAKEEIYGEFRGKELTKKITSMGQKEVTERNCPAATEKSLQDMICECNLMNGMHLIPRMATALVFFIYIGEEGLNAQYVARRFVTKQLCGSALSNELQLVCEGVYNNMIKKAEENEAQPTEWRRIDIDEDNYAIFPFRSRRNALAFNTANFFRRRIRSIVQECCKKPCHILEMRNYCGR